MSKPAHDVYDAAAHAERLESVFSEPEAPTPPQQQPRAWAPDLPANLLGAERSALQRLSPRRNR